MNLPKSNTNNSLPISGNIEVKENIPGDFEFVIESNRCSLDLKKCEKYGNINFRQICKLFMDENSFFKAFFSGIEPPLKCPLTSGNYTITDSAVDLNIVSFFPLDGYVWMVTFSLVSSEKGSKHKKVAMCINTETKIVKVVKRN